MSAAGTPESPDDYFGFIERVVEMASDLRHVDTSQARHASLCVHTARTRQERQDLQCLLKFIGEYVNMDPMLEPPPAFTIDVPLCRGREANPAWSQRARSSLRTSSASTRRPSATSTSESLSA
jgi:hypothetical protein